MSRTMAQSSPASRLAPEAHAGPLHRAPVRRLAVDDHLPGPGVHLVGAVGDHPRLSACSSEADLKWVFGAFAFAYALFEVPTRLAGRRLRAAEGADPHRALVVVLHGADRG